MKKVKFLPVAFVCVLIALLGVCVTSLSATAYAYADEAEPYSFYFENYGVTYDIAKNRKINVTEKMEVRFTGYASTGFIKDIPVNGGEQVRNVKVYSLDGFDGTERKSVKYSVSCGTEFVSVDVGDYSRKTGESRTFLLTYEYRLTKAQEGKNALSLNPVGLGRDCEMKNASVTLILPEGFISAKAKVGTENNAQELEFEKTADGGKTVLDVKKITLKNNEGITVDMKFESGALSAYFDFTPYWFVIAVAALIAVAVLLRLFAFNKNALTPVVNYEAPDKMDPLLMGKLIDGKVDGTDVTAMIYYWACKGYLKINLDEKNNPTLIRVVQTLPAGSPEYEQTLFYGLFAAGDTVKPSQLRNKFYRVADKAKAQLNAGVKGLYDKVSVTVSVILAALAAVITGLAPFAFALTVSTKYIFFPAFIALVPAFIIYRLTYDAKRNAYKLSKRRLALQCGVAAAVGVGFTALYVMFIPSCLIAVTPKLLIALAGSALAGASTLTVSRTKEYNVKLGEIVGFKDFIRLTEKDRIEKMLEDDPQFFYRVLPYAQALGVTDVWENKFADLTVQPPDWLTGNVATTAVRFHVINSVLRSSADKMATDMISRPSSSGSGGRGGFGGGSIGGGHGGGGFRGR